MILSAVTSTAKDRDRNPRKISPTEENDTTESIDTTKKNWERPISKQQRENTPVN